MDADTSRHDVTPRQAAMVAMMRATSGIQRALEAVCAEHGLTHDQYNVLRILRGAHPTGHPRYAIAERMLSRAPDVTRILGRLEKQGLVERYRSPADQRLSMARATGPGRRLLDAVDPHIQSVHETAAGSLTEAEARQLGELCARLTEPPADA